MNRLLPYPKFIKDRDVPLPFAGCHAIKCPPGWENAAQPLTDLGENFGGWTAFIERDESLEVEAYCLQVENAKIVIRAGSPRAAFYACQTLLQRWDGTALPLFEVEDTPSMAWRGVVEGFYGVPWSHKARLQMLDYMGQVKMNLFLYAPKDDPYHRELWREPYPEEEAARLQEAIERAKTNFIEFGFCISPGLSMVYSDPDEFRKLTAKIEAVQAMGVHAFGLLVDDIPEELQHEADKAVYRSLAHAHADLGNRLNEWLKQKDPEGWLILCPTFYHNLGEPPYVKELGEKTDSGISIMWTGKKVVSRTITEGDCRLFTEAIRRKPFVWDNYPVNDYETSRLLLAPITGREEAALQALEALVVNPMNQAEASKIGIGTFADLLWNARDYNPERSWRAAIRSIVGNEACETFLEFCKENIWTRHWTNEPPAIARAIEDWQTLGDTDALQSELERLIRVAATTRLKIKNVALMEEIEPWLSKMEQISEAGLEVLEKIESDSLDYKRLERIVETLKSNEAIVCGGWIERWLTEVASEA